jgi:hypothetical protein
MIARELVGQTTAEAAGGKSGGGGGFDIGISECLGDTGDEAGMTCAFHLITVMFTQLPAREGFYI